MTSNLPQWTGAAYIYHRLYALLRHKGPQWSIRSRHGRTWQCTVCEEMQEIIDALNKGTEERLKWFNMFYDKEIREALSVNP